MGEVIKLGDVPANDIPRMLRLMADKFEEGDFPETELAAFILKTSDSIGVFGWGELGDSTPELYTLLGAAQLLILRDI